MEPAASRFDLTKPNWVRVDGIPISSSPAALAIGTIQTTITVASDGSYLAPAVWTGGLTPNVKGNAQTTCADWSDAGATGMRGRTNFASSAFFYNEYDVPCSNSNPVYCFQE